MNIMYKGLDGVYYSTSDSLVKADNMFRESRFPYTDKKVSTTGNWKPYGYPKK